MITTLQLTQNADAGLLCPSANKNAQKRLASSVSCFFISVKGRKAKKPGLFSSSMRIENNNLPSARKKNPIESP